MVRPTRRIGLLVLAALALHAPGSDAASPPFRVNAAWRRGHPYAVRFDSLEVRGERAAAWAGLDSAIAAAGARHDDALLVPLLEESVENWNASA